MKKMREERVYLRQGERVVGMQGEGVRASMDASRRAYSRVGAHIVL